MAEPWGVYLRISEARDGSTLGVERQQPPTEALVARMGGEVAKVYADNDLSGYLGKRRPAYEEMLRDAKTGVIRGVAAWHPDRLTRQPVENEALIDLVNAYGVKLATALVGDHDLTVPQGRMAFRMLGTVARYESEHRAERLRLKYDQLAAAGLPKGTGKRPFGYRGVELVPEEAALLSEAAARLLDKGETLGAIVRDWNARGVTTTTGRRWTVSVLRRTLQNPRLYGARVHRGEVVGEAKWPAILDRGTWDALQRRFADPVRRAGGAPERHLLSGVLVCGQPGCGAKLYYRTKAGRGVYACLSGAQGGCGRVSVDAGRVEEWVEAAVLEAFDSPRFAAVLHGEADQQGRARLGARLTQLEAGQREAYDDYRVHRVINRAQYLAANAKLESQLRAVRRELDRLDRAQMVLELPEGTSTLRQAWAVADTDWRRRAVKLALTKVEVLPKVPGARPRFTPVRLDPDWRA
jgi:DNA invertase Pin-like site-specific DNA recombinase